MVLFSTEIQVLESMLPLIGMHNIVITFFFFPVILLTDFFFKKNLIVMGQPFTRWQQWINILINYCHQMVSPICTTEKQSLGKWLLKCWSLRGKLLRIAVETLNYTKNIMQGKSQSFCQTQLKNNEVQPVLFFIFLYPKGRILSN